MKQDDWKERRDKIAGEYAESIEKQLRTQIEILQFKAGWNAGREDLLKELAQAREFKEQDERSW